MIQKRTGVTLMEMMVVVVVIGILAGFAIPSYTKSKERAYERTAVNHLNLINEALGLYWAHEGAYPSTSDLDNLSEINNTLSLGIMDADMTYVCIPANLEGGGPGGFDCRITSPSGWRLHVHTDSGSPWDEVHCNTGDCPTCNPSCSY